MANFQPSVTDPADFDVAGYQLSLPVDNARYACLYGGGPGGLRLNVVALTDTGAPTTAISLLERQASDAEGPSVRRFRVRAIREGTFSIHAQIPGGNDDYSAPLLVRVLPDRGDGRIMRTAFDASRSSLRVASHKLTSLDIQLIFGAPRGAALPDEDRKTYDIAQKWLKFQAYNQFDTLGQLVARGAIVRANMLIAKNLRLDVKDFMRTGEGVYGRAPIGNVVEGMECGTAFFDHGPNCRRDVVTHEFFHMVGVGHGEKHGDPIPEFADRALVNSVDLALNSADHLAQMVAELNGAVCDACLRPAD